jgi:glutamine phosphoribosylpyrophosphate amidotransferase
LGYLSHDGLMQAVGVDSSYYCTACFSGDYSIKFPNMGNDPQMELFEKEQSS